MNKELSDKYQVVSTAWVHFCYFLFSKLTQKDFLIKNIEGISDNTINLFETHNKNKKEIDEFYSTSKSFIEEFCIKHFN